jgi:hypothetical protein
MNTIYSDLKQHFYSFPANRKWKLYGQTGNTGTYYPSIYFSTAPCTNNEEPNEMCLEYYVPFLTNTGSYTTYKDNMGQISIWFESEKRFLKIFNNWETIVQNIQLLSLRKFDIACCQYQTQSIDESIDAILYQNDLTPESEYDEGIRIDLSVPIISLPD